MPRPVLAARWALAGYLVFLAVALLSPTSSEQSHAVVLAGRLLTGLLPDAWLTFGRLEVLANVALMVPAGFLVRAGVRRSRWQDWTAYGFLAAAAVEGAQGLLLPHRQASFSDIVANTLGVAIGAALAGLALRAVRHVVRDGAA